ncbi:MAG: UDP-N-acetylmuramate--L-alanine ligase [Planctomycetes bacterium]|nr:UDP-N-acetylmuramate--L-alanine ligase [Planctomycetota bacterium]
MFSDGNHIHFVGIGGAGVSGLARIALEAGHSVSGSDMKESTVTQGLRALGASISIGHGRENVPIGTALAVVSAAIKPENPEYAEAARRGLRVIKYSQALGELTQLRESLCVCGTHGKTTTTAMLAQIMLAAGTSPSYLVGGEPKSLTSHAAWKDGRHFVVESCEYDRSFLRLHPRVVILNNIEEDHLDCYGDIAGVEQGFADFIARLPKDGLLLFNADDARCAKLAAKTHRRAEGFGAAASATWRMHELDASTGFARARVSHSGKFLGALALEIPGRLNAINAMGALAAACSAGVEPALALSALKAYRGVARRFECIGQIAGVPLIDDYAHHPTAVAHLIETARKTFGKKRLVAVFQAHQYARMNGMFDGFVDAFGDADRVLVARTYAARESGVVAGEPERRFAKALRARGVEAADYDDFAAIKQDLALKTAPSDVLIFIGAGDVNEIAYDLLNDRDFTSARLHSLLKAEAAA